MATQVLYQVGQGVQGLVVGDFNNDGAHDLVTANVSDHTLSMLFNNGDGTFATQVVFGSAAFAGGITSADFNGDGLLDLAALLSTPQILVFINPGSGNFSSSVNYTVGSAPQTVAHGDGWPDLAVSSPADNSVGVLLGAGDGTFGVVTPYGAGTTPSGLAAADFNKDGRFDLVTSSGTTNPLSVLLYSGCH